MRILEAPSAQHLCQRHFTANTKARQQAAAAAAQAPTAASTRSRAPAQSLWQATGATGAGRKRQRELSDSEAEAEAGLVSTRRRRAHAAGPASSCPLSTQTARSGPACGFSWAQGRWELTGRVLVLSQMQLLAAQTPRCLNGAHCCRGGG